MNKRWGAGILAAAMLFLTTPQVNAEEVISEDIYQWVQSTSRQNYYFNKQQIYFGIDNKGNIDPDILLVPVLKTYDQVQKEDVIAKRRWKMQSTKGYNDLVGAAQFFRFDLKNKTVELTKQDDLDSDWGVLDETAINKVVNLDQFSDKDVDGKFFHAIINYAMHHLDEITIRTENKYKTKLTSSAQQKIAEFKEPGSTRKAPAEKHKHGK